MASPALSFRHQPVNGISIVPLVRTFRAVPAYAETEEQIALGGLFGDEADKRWQDLQNEHRCVIIASAGIGKTHEMLEQAKHVAFSGRYSFFIRIEDIDHTFENAFEVGNAALFAKWLSSSSEAWFFLDSVDESRLSDPQAFGDAMRRFSSRINDGYFRARIFISARPYAWRPSDRQLIEELFPFSPFAEKLEDGSKTVEERNSLQVYSLRPLTDKQIEDFAYHRATPDIPQLLATIERAQLAEFAERPYDLDALLLKWASDRQIESRLEFVQFLVRHRLKQAGLT